MRGVIYEIVNAVNGKRYIGSTSSENPMRRWWCHTARLRNNKHYNRKLQFAWNKYGENNFKFTVLDRIENYPVGRFPTILALEQSWLDKTNVAVRGYNLQKTARRGRLHKPTSEETKQKMSAALSGDKHPNWGKKMSTAWIANMKRAVTGIKKPDSGCRKQAALVGPGGCAFHVDGIRRFARRHNLNVNMLCKVIKGKTKSHRGFSLSPIPG